MRSLLSGGGGVSLASAPACWCVKYVGAQLSHESRSLRSGNTKRERPQGNCERHRYSVCGGCPASDRLYGQSITEPEPKLPAHRRRCLVFPRVRGIGSTVSRRLGKAGPTENSNKYPVTAVN